MKTFENQTSEVFLNLHDVNNDGKVFLPTFFRLYIPLLAGDSEKLTQRLSLLAEMDWCIL